MAAIRTDSTRSLGSSGVHVTAMGLGCAPLGNLFRAVSDDDARATVDGALGAGIDFYDTAPLYGSGLSETRLGELVAGRDVVISSKCGRVLDEALSPDPIFVGALDRGPRFDFSPAGIRTSVESSLERLDRDRLDICWVHDPDDHEPEARDAAFPTLRSLQDEGLVRAVGVGMNEPAMPTRFVNDGLVDAVLIAGCWSLLDQSAGEELLPTCAERNIGVVVGGVFGSGVLADPWSTEATYRYETAAPQIVERARALHRLCDQHGVPPLAAAVRFPFRHEAVSSVIVGARSADEIAANVEAFETDVPDELWTEMVAAGLLAEDVLA